MFAGIACPQAQSTLRINSSQLVAHSVERMWGHIRSQLMAHSVERMWGHIRSQLMAHSVERMWGPFAPSY